MDSRYFDTGVLWEREKRLFLGESAKHEKSIKHCLFLYLLRCLPPYSEAVGGGVVQA